MLPQALLVAIAVQAACQLFKLVWYSWRDKRVGWHYLVTTGGVPSAHAAFVSALSVAVGLRSGFAADVFAVAAVLSLIVIYDAYRLRGNVEQHARRLNLLQRLLTEDPPAANGLSAGKPTADARLDGQPPTSPAPGGDRLGYNAPGAWRKIWAAEKPLSEMIGHSPLELLVGVIVGAGSAVLINHWLGRL